MTRRGRHHGAAGAAAGLLAMATLIAAHPGCYDDSASLLQDTPLVFCPVEEEGVCCTPDEEQEAILLYSEHAQAIQEASDNTLGDACGEAWRQVTCGRCSSYAGHLYSRLGAELGLGDGMTLKNDFCEDMVSKCDGLIDFKTYDGVSYCDKHTEDEDEVWSYPIDPEERATFTSTGLTSAFPNLDDDWLPEELISMKMTPDGSSWWLIGQTGTIMQVPAEDPTSSVQVLDLKSDFDLRYDYEEGLLDIAFDPDFSNNKYFYCSYTIENADGAEYRNRLARFQNSTSVDATLGTYTEILTSDVKSTRIHSAGWVDFKPTTRDIYWAIGDGGPQMDTEARGSDLTNILASIVRVRIPTSGDILDFDFSPPGNLQGPICASGWRNPFRCGFDKQSPHALYCGDVGHDHVEEINEVECGNDYGWSRFEGSRCQEEQNERFGEIDCDVGLPRDAPNLVFPIFEYCHRSYPDDPDEVAYLTDGVDICGDRTIEGEAAIGGHPYRGKRFEEVLSGAVIFGDAQQRNIHYLTKNADGTWDSGTIIGDGSASVISFAEDNDGEQYVITRERKAFQLPCGLFCGEPEEAEEGETDTCLDLGDTEEEVPSYSSEGCWADLDTDARALYLDEPDCPKGQRLMSPEICARYCSTVPGATYFGLEFAYECFCGNDDSTATGFKRNGELSMETDCVMLCTDASGDTCGGMSAIEVFAFGDVSGPAPTPVPPVDSNAGYESVDCFVDDKDDRVLSIEAQKTPNDEMTTQLCAALCEGKGTYFGTQFEYECFCSDDTKDEYDRLGTEGAECASPCSGDPSQTCGGTEAIQVYMYTGDVAPSPVAPSPVAPTPSPMTIATTGDYSALGCFVDSQTDRVLSIWAQKDVNDFMTIEKCAETCAALGSTYFGLQYAYECFCSDDTKDEYDRLGTEGAECASPCSGDPSQTCGGTDANEIYQLTGAQPSPVAPTTPSPVTPTTPSPVTIATTGDYSALGCFVDSQTDRVLSIWAQKAVNDFMTIEKCAETCAALGSTYFGLQYAYECFCSDDTKDEYDRLGTEGAECAAPCSGDSSQTCGGTDANEIYQLTGAQPSPVAPTTPSPVTPTTPSPMTTSDTGDYSSLGCFADDRENRVLSIWAQKAENDFMTVEYCADTCADNGSTYFGVQYAYQCFCSEGNDTPSTVGPSTNCNMECVGDDSQICGGEDAFTAYQFDGEGPAPTPPSPTPSSAPSSGGSYSEIGCFADFKDDRVMSVNFPQTLTTTNDVMTAEYCAEKCAGSEYFGTQYRYQCFCSTPADLPLTLVTEGAICNEPCSGNAQEMCGGEYALTMYQFDD